MRFRLASDAANLRAKVIPVLPLLVRQWLPEGEQRGEIYFALNPRRNDRGLGSFQINTVTGHWRDYAISEGGRDAVSLYAYLFTGGDYKAAIKALADDPLIEAAVVGCATTPPAKPAKSLKLKAAKLAEVRRIYDNASGLTGMPAATYLQSRGLRPTEAWDCLRASVQRYPMVGACPVLIAPIDDPNGAMVGLQCTYLTPLGKKLPVPDPRRTLGTARGGAIRLGEAKRDLVICEGLEDGLTLYQELGGDVSVWVACGASFLHLIAVPAAVRRLTIAADNDAAGRRAAWRAADAFSVGGRVVRIWPPRSGFKDFNDQIRGIRSKASRND